MARNKERDYDPSERHETTSDPKGGLAHPSDILPSVDPAVEDTSFGDAPSGNLGDGNHWVDRTPTDE